MLRPCSLKDVRHLFAEHHGYGDAGGTATYCYAWFEAGIAIAAFVWQPPAYGAAKSVCPEAPHGVLALSRMVAVPRSERQLQRLSDALREQFCIIDRTRWPVLITYSDEGQGHNGWVYRAARMKHTARRQARVFTDAQGIRRSSLTNGTSSTAGLTRQSDTIINRWEQWVCPRGSAAHYMGWHGWKREPIPGKVWASGKQAHRIIMTDIADIAPAAMGSPPPMVPVRDISGKRLTPDVIRAFVLVAMQHARARPDQSYRVVAKGWGYPNAVIAPMFDYAPDNICLPLWGWMNK